MSDSLRRANTATTNEPTDDQLLAIAPTSAYVAVITLVLSGVALVLFFGGVGYVFGPINDVLVAATLFLLIPVALAVRRLAAGQAGQWFTVLTWIAIAGMLEAAVGQLLLVVGLISLQTSFLTGAVGIVPVLAWIGGVSYLALRRDVLDRPTGLWGAAFLGTSAVTAVAGPFLPQPVLYAMGFPLAVAAVGFLWSLARALKLVHAARPS
ncbi:MAG: hypothetical protein M3N29_01340 [Chloroflexota bacterium]|nr:hypothetical protein [Chloroflexota bacterium]